MHGDRYYCVVEYGTQKMSERCPHPVIEFPTDEDKDYVGFISSIFRLCYF